MGKIVPVLLALILKLCDVNLFKEESNTGCEPLISSLIFLISLSIMLLKMNLYPEAFRKLRGFFGAFWDVINKLN